MSTNLVIALTILTYYAESPKYRKWFIHTYIHTQIQRDIDIPTYLSFQVDPPNVTF